MSNKNSGKHAGPHYTTDATVSSPASGMYREEFDKKAARNDGFTVRGIPRVGRPVHRVAGDFIFGGYNSKRNEFDTTFVPLKED